MHASRRTRKWSHPRNSKLVARRALPWYGTERSRETAFGSGCPKHSTRCLPIQPAARAVDIAPSRGSGTFQVPG